MYDLTDVKVGDEVVYFYTPPMGELSAVVYEVVRETPKRLVIKRESGAKYWVEKATGKIIGEDEYVRRMGEEEYKKISSIQERDRIKRMRRALVKAIQEQGSLSDSQVQRMYAIMWE